MQLFIEAANKPIRKTKMYNSAPQSNNNPIDVEDVRLPNILCGPIN